MKLAEEFQEDRDQLFLGFRRFSILAATTIAIVVMMTPVVFEHFRTNLYKQGDVAPYNIVSSTEFPIENPVASEQRRSEAESAVKRVFVLDDRSASGPAEQLKAFFANLKEQGVTNKTTGRFTVSTDARSTIEAQFRVNFSDAEWTVLEDMGNWPVIQDELVRLLDPIYEQGVIANKRVLQNALNTSSGAVLRRAENGKEQEIVAEDMVFSLREGISIFDTDFPDTGFGRGAVYDSVMSKLGHLMIKPNVTFDKDETERRTAAVRAEVEPALEQVRRGEVVVRSGEVVTAQQQRKLERLREISRVNVGTRTVIGYLIITSLILITVYLFTASVWIKFRPTSRDLIMMACCLVGSFFLVKLHLVLGRAFSQSYSDLDTTMLVVAAPLAAGGILLQVTLGSASVFYFTMSFALLADILFESTWIFLLLIIMGNIVGAVSVKRASRRSIFLLAGGRIAVVNLIVVICYILLNPPAVGTTNAIRMLCALVGGVMSGVFAAALTPIAEFIGKYITDIKLLELGSLDRPILRDLAMEAPGTWNHSVVMGQMAESAAEAVGANGLLARVGAYYHDIGKTRKPTYFTENQAGIDNRHDKLTPSMSALIIRAHVKDGIEMAREAGLPQAIIDFIPQHHGTALIEYFYEKAKKEAHEGEVVDKSHYCYPGPRPQTKEAGILMLADNVEATARSLPDPTPTKIQGMVQKIMNKIFASGQLDECELTLSDLHQIAKAFTRVLGAIYHRRVEYQESGEKGREKVVEKSESTEKLEKEQQHTEAPKTGTENGANETDGRKSSSRSSSETNGSRRSETTPPDKGPPTGGKETLKRLGL